jgi:hypothetical protein
MRRMTLGPRCNTGSEFFRQSRLGKTYVELVAVATTAQGERDAKAGLHDVAQEEQNSIYMRWRAVEIPPLPATSR